MRFARGDLRDQIVSYQNDHRPSYWLQRALRLQESLKISFRGIFGVIRFSTFATISAQSGHSKHRLRPVRDALRDRNDLKLLTGCTYYIPNSFAHQKPCNWGYEGNRTG